MPQSVSFAAMAGVPAAFGLYTAFVPVLAYCLMGSSRHLVSPHCTPCSMTLTVGVSLLACTLPDESASKQAHSQTPLYFHTFPLTTLRALMAAQHS